MNKEVCSSGNTRWSTKSRT